MYLAKESEWNQLRFEVSVERGESEAGLVEAHLYAEKAPGRTEMYPNEDSVGLSRMLDI